MPHDGGVFRCPPLETLGAFRASALPLVLQQQVGLHLVNCNDCSSAFLSRRPAAVTATPAVKARRASAAKAKPTRKVKTNAKAASKPRARRTAAAAAATALDQPRPATQTPAEITHALPQSDWATFVHSLSTRLTQAARAAQNATQAFFLRYQSKYQPNWLPRRR
ncbi:MAG: hypothetical protein ACRD9R_16325 [Pyrinomonadaceae bacterium]